MTDPRVSTDTGTDLLIDLEAPGSDDLALDLRDGRATVSVPDAAVVTAGSGVVDEETAIVGRRWSLLAALVVLNLLDLVTTRAVLAAGGSEVNPIMSQIIDQPVTPVLVKSAGLLLVALVLRSCPPRAGLVDRALLLVTGLYGVVVAWNAVNLALY